MRPPGSLAVSVGKKKEKKEWWGKEERSRRGGPGIPPSPQCGHEGARNDLKLMSWMAGKGQQLISLVPSGTQLAYIVHCKMLYAILGQACSSNITFEPTHPHHWLLAGLTGRGLGYGGPHTPAKRRCCLSWGGLGALRKRLARAKPPYFSIANDRG